MSSRLAGSNGKTKVLRQLASKQARTLVLSMKTRCVVPRRNMGSFSLTRWAVGFIAFASDPCGNFVVRQAAKAEWKGKGFGNYQSGNREWKNNGDWKNRGMKRPRESEENKRCYTCNGFGHLAKDCTKKAKGKGK
jgi:hypothetical protein